MYLVKAIPFILLTGFFLPSIAQEKVVWEYPINSSSIEWKNLKNYYEQLQAYNIPTEVIKKISTAELVKTCLSYPEWRLINAYNDRQIGLANVMQLFNGFHELFIRNDAAKELIKVYVKMDPSSIDITWTPLQKGIFSFKFICIEMLLSHSAIINKLEASDISILLDDAVSKYKSMLQMKDLYSLWDLSALAGMCLNVLDKDEVFVKENPDLRSFQQSFMTENIEILNKIIEKSEKK